MMAEKHSENQKMSKIRDTDLMNEDPDILIKVIEIEDDATTEIELNQSVAEDRDVHSSIAESSNHVVVNTQNEVNQATKRNHTLTTYVNPRMKKIKTGAKSESIATVAPRLQTTATAIVATTSNISERCMYGEISYSVRRARTRTRGARRGGRGVRTRGGRRKPPAERPRAIDELVIQELIELPEVRPLETPLHPKRRRMRPPSPMQKPSPSPPRVESPCRVPSPGMFAECEAVAGSSNASGASELMFAECEAVAGSSNASDASELMFADRAVQPPPPRNLRERDASDFLNYGSEEESSEDEEVSQLQIPRVLENIMDTPVDEDDVLEHSTPAAEERPTSAAEERPTSAAEDLVMNQPTDLFNFEWKTFPTPSIQPERRRETFSQSNVGPATPKVDPYEIFTEVWDRPIMEYIASETNKYAQQVASQMFETNNLHPRSRIGQWVDTTVDELYVFFGILLAMAIVVKTRVEEYWGVTCWALQTPGFNALMSINRFLLLCKCIHFNDNLGIGALNLRPSEAKLFKISPIISHLNSKFQSLYTPNQNLALDESLLMWKGLLKIGQLIPNKAARKGIKTYEICESQTGYLWRFEVHAHQGSQTQPSPDPLAASTPSIVRRLVKGLEFKGYTIWMDNFYNSPCLARHLKSLGLDVAGTLRTNRQFVPQVLHNLTKLNMCQGEITGLTSGDVDVMVWKDNNRVAMISTYHGNAQSRTRGSIKPILISDYNIMMGGVDKKDQLLAMYPVERKRGKVWYKKLFRRLLNVSVLNSYVIHRANVSSSPSSPLTHRLFRMNLVDSLFSKHSQICPLPNPIPLSLPKPIQLARPDVTHRLAEWPLKGKQRMRRLCVCCKKQIRTYCVGCGKAACMEPCFLNIHS